MAFVLLFLFKDSFKSGYVHFSNDTPLGGEVAQWDYLTDNLNGAWQPLYWLGNENIANRPTISLLFGLLAGDAVIHHKFFVPFSLFLIGICSLFCFRQFNIKGEVAFIAALAATLNMSAFSNSCWGLPYWQISRALTFLGIGFAIWKKCPNPWIRAVMSGGCIGMGVMEGYDIGALFSVFAAAVAFCWSLLSDSPSSETAPKKRITTSVIGIAIMAVTAGIVATHGLSSLINTQVKGVAGVEQTPEAKVQKWDFATQWSLPKKEVVRFAIPGILGYRMDEPDGGQYWGSVGENPGLEELKEWAKQNPQAASHLNSPNTYRYSGSGEHAGILILILAAWALIMTHPKANSSFSEKERRFIWCLGGIALISLLLAFGKHAPFYQLFYQLPYASTIRNPIKFTQPMHLALIFLFAFGLNDLWKRFIRQSSELSKPESPVGDWLRCLPDCYRNWVKGSMALAVLSVVGLIIYVGCESRLVAYMTSTAIPEEDASKIFSFSVGEYVFFMVFFAASIIAINLSLKGKFANSNAPRAFIFLTLLVVFDLGRSNAYWVKHYNYANEYESNPVFEKLKESPYEGRVAIAPNPGAQAMGFIEQVYRIHWLHKHFQFHGIHSLDIAQESRMGEDKVTYLKTLQQSPQRYWQLNNVRYLIGLHKLQSPQGEMGFIDVLNAQLDPQKRRFKVAMAFQLGQDPTTGQLRVVEDQNGPFALIEFGGALSRAVLHSTAEVISDDQTLLNKLIAPDFDPEKTVLLSEAPKTQPSGGDTEGSATIKTYEPKRVGIDVTASTDSILTLNDRYHPHWKAYLNGTEVPVLRANYIARAIEVPAGSNKVEFRFEPPSNTLYVSLFGIFLTLGTVGFVLFTKGSSQGEAHPEQVSEKKTKPGSVKGKKKNSQ